MSLISFLNKGISRQFIIIRNKFIDNNKLQICKENYLENIQLPKLKL